MEQFRPTRQGTLRVLLALIAAVTLARAVPAAPPQRGAAAGPFVVQVGAYPGPRTANPMAAELAGKGFPAIVLAGGGYHRVVVGPFASEPEASAALSRLQRAGYQGYVRGDLPIPGTSETAAAPSERPAAAQPAPATRRTEAPRPAQPARAQQSARAGRFVVQVGAYGGLQTAAPLAAELLQRGFPAMVVPGSDYARVVVGPFANESQASAMLSGLQQQGYQGYVRGDLPIPRARETVAAQSDQPTAVQPAPVTQPPPVTQPVEAPRLAEAAPPPEPAQPSPPVPIPTVPREAQAPVSPAVPPQQTRPVEAAATTPLPEAAPPPTPPEPAATTPIAEPTTAQQAVPDAPAAVAPAAAPGAPPVSEPQQQETAALLPPQPQPRIRAGTGLRLLVLAGHGAINNIKQRTSRDPVVQVMDENDRPLAGVAITFALPDRGASGLFANGARSMTIMTDAQGTATATGFTPNAVAGDLPIQVSASYQGQTASTVIPQTNIVAAGAGMSAATIGIIGAVVAGAAVGAVVALSGGETTAAPGRPSGTATVRTGGVTIGAPSQ